MSISDSLKHLEQEIGYPPFSGAPYGEETITPAQRLPVISWLTIKGVEKSNLDKSSLTVLGKLYRIEKYFEASLRNQERDTKSRPFKKPNSDISADWAAPLDSIEPKPTHSAPADFIDKHQLDVAIRNIIKENLRTEGKQLQDEIISVVHEFLIKEFDANNHQAAEIASKQVEIITRASIHNEMRAQGENLKKFIEEQIFQGYLNHKKQNLTDAPAPVAERSDAPCGANLPTNNSLIPTLDPNYHFDPYATKVIRSALNMCENLYVYGDTGCGKTTHLEQVCAVMSRGLVRINPHDGITREMFLGGMKLINNETIFIEGALPKAMREGLVLLVDEISFLPPNLTAILNPIGEKGGKLYISETSEWISPAPGFCLFATDNTGGKGDRTGNYTGTEVQNTATLDRFAFCLKMDYLPSDKECEMLIKRFPSHSIGEIEKMQCLAKDIRLAFSRGELSLTLSTRKLIKFFDQRINNFTIQEALSNTILSWLDEDDETLVKTMIDRLDLLSITPPPIKSLDFDLTNFQIEILSDRLVSAIKILRTIVSENGGDIGLRYAKELAEEYRDNRYNLDEVKRRLQQIIGGF